MHAKFFSKKNLGVGGRIIIIIIIIIGISNE
jgi:hypothetical protein